MDEGISTEIWILDSIDRRPSKGGIWTRRRQTVWRRVAGGGRREGRANEGKAERTRGAVESFSERIKARERDRLVRRVTKG